MIPWGLLFAIIQECHSKGFTDTFCVSAGSARNHLSIEDSIADGAEGEHRTIIPYWSIAFTEEYSNGYSKDGIEGWTRMSAVELR